MSEYTRETEVRNGYLIQIIADDDAQYEDCALSEGMMTFAHGHKGYAIDGTVRIEDFIECYGAGDWDGIRRRIRKEHRGCEIVTVRGYEHSGLTISANPGPGESQFYDRWDSGTFGVVVMTKQQMCHWWQCRRVTPSIRQKSREAMVSVVEEIDRYLTGDVWGYVVTKLESAEGSDDPDITDANGYEWVKGGEVESCSNFAGFEYCLEEARELVDHLALRYTPHAISQTRGRIKWGVRDNAEGKILVAQGSTYNTRRVAERFAAELNAGVRA